MPTEPLVFLKMPEVKRRTGLGKTTIYDRISAGTFPPPVPLGGKAVAWVEAEVEAWQAARVAERNGTEPARAA